MTHILSTGFQNNNNGNDNDNDNDNDNNNDNNNDIGDNDNNDDDYDNDDNINLQSLACIANLIKSTPLHLDLSFNLLKHIIIIIKRMIMRIMSF